jgi:hypothetical protein
MHLGVTLDWLHGSMEKTKADGKDCDSGGVGRRARAKKPSSGRSGEGEAKGMKTNECVQA